MPAISQSSGAAADAGGTSIAIIPPAADCALTSHTLTQITLTDANANGDVCLFAIGATPPDPNNVRVLTEDDRVVPISDTDGWQYLSGYETIQFVGGYCDLVLQGTLVNPRMLFGCASHFIP
jgi:hypothetical protein